MLYLEGRRKVVNLWLRIAIECGTSTGAAQPDAAADGVRKPRCARQRTPRQTVRPFGGLEVVDRWWTMDGLTIDSECAGKRGCDVAGRDGAILGTT